MRVYPALRHPHIYKRKTLDCLTGQEGGFRIMQEQTQNFYWERDLPEVQNALATALKFNLKDLEQNRESRLTARQQRRLFFTSLLKLILAPFILLLTGTLFEATLLIFTPALTVGFWRVAILILIGLIFLTPSFLLALRELHMILVSLSFLFIILPRSLLGKQLSIIQSYRGFVRTDHKTSHDSETNTYSDHYYYKIEKEEFSVSHQAHDLLGRGKYACVYYYSLLGDKRLLSMEALKTPVEE
jgi:hypothetical protein